MSGEGNWIRVTSADELPAGEMMAVTVEGKNIALYHLDNGEFHATDNICTHQFAIMTDGWLEDCYIECPLHAGRFDVRTGKGQGDPIDEDLKVFPVKVEGDAVLVRVS